MHIILGLLGSVVTILYLLHRLASMGIDLGGLNPFLWHRRRKWKINYTANPIFAIESPMEVTALLVAATAKADGDMSSEEKAEILSMFTREFHLPEGEASSLLVSSVHLLNAGDEIKNDMKVVLEASLPKFTGEQAISAVALIERIAQVGSGPTQSQQDLISEAKSLLIGQPQNPGKWQ